MKHKKITIKFKKQRGVDELIFEDMTEKEAHYEFVKWCEENKVKYEDTYPREVRNEA